MRRWPQLLSAAVGVALAVMQGVAAGRLGWIGGHTFVLAGAIAVLFGISVWLEFARSSPRAPDRAVPEEVPRDIADFTGREDELAELTRLVKHGSPTVLISAVHGTAGVGKSTLAVHLAHRVRRRFPDGCLYVNLRGADDDPERVHPRVALEHFLGALGEARKDIPRRLDAAEARYRSLLAGRRVLVLLDNAADEAQVRPLLPGGPSCAVLITSRSQLAGLESVHTVRLREFSEDEALDLLRQIVGKARINASPAEARAIVGYCGRLPLALRIAGAKLRARPEWTVAGFAAKLADERGRLSELRAGHLDVRASFMLSYTELNAEEARLFRALGAFQAAEMPLEAAAALLDTTAERAEALLDKLVALHLLEAPSERRYGFHDLLRLFAREEAARTEPAAERARSTERVLRWYLDRTRDAVTADDARGRAWLATEHDALLALVDQVVTDPALASYAWELACALAPEFERRADHAAWRETARAATAAADTAADPAALARTRLNTARLHLAADRAEQAEGAVAEAAAYASELADPVLAAEVHRVRGRACRLLGRRDEAEGELRAALRELGESGERLRRVACLTELGGVVADRGRYQDAVALLVQAGELHGADASDGMAAEILHSAAEPYRRLGRFDEACAALLRAREIHRRHGDAERLAAVSLHLGIVHDSAGRPAEALAAYDEAGGIYERLGDTASAARQRLNRAVTLARSGDVAAALNDAERALDRFRAVGDRASEAGALMNVGTVLFGRGEHRRAADLYGRAAVLYRSLDDDVGRAEALSARGRAREEAGRLRAAVRDHAESCGIRRRLQDDRALVESLVNLGLVEQSLGRTAAERHLREAMAVAAALEPPDHALTATTLLHVAGAEARTGRLAAASARLDRARRSAREAGEPGLEAEAVMLRARIMRAAPHRSGDSGGEVARLYETAARLFGDAGDSPGRGRALCCLAVAYAWDGDPNAARSVLVRAERELREADADDVLEVCGRLRSDLEEDPGCGLPELAW